MTSRLIFMTSCDCETYYLYCAICQQTSEHLRINNVSPFFPSIGLTALSASFSSFSSSSSKWQFTLSKLWGFPIGATGQWDLFSFSFFLHYLNVWWKCTKILFFIACCFGIHSVCMDHHISSFTRVCVWILLLSLLYCISLTDSCCPNKSGLLLCKCV